ncbi:MAG: hypothetical protein CMJ83_00165 [Planctomycetes bacterium]|nr:hypothetical protein [Planctomycetota bacterium]
MLRLTSLLLVVCATLCPAQARLELQDESLATGTVQALHAEGVLFATGEDLRLVPWSTLRTLRTTSQVPVALANGDRITGRITGFDGERLTVVTTLFAALSVPVSELSSAPPSPAESVARSDAVVEKAEDQEKKGILEEKDWNGRIALLGTLRTGNVDSSLFQLTVGINRQWRADRLATHAAFAYGQTEGETTATNAEAGVKWDHFYDADFYSYARTDLEFDDIKQLDLRAILGIGVGLNLWRGEKDHQSFDVEGGIDGIYEDFQTSEDTEFDPAGRIAFTYKNRFFEDLLFTEEFQVLFPIPDASDFIMNSKTTLSVAISDNWQLKNILEIEYQGDPPNAVKNLDLKLLLGLEYKF